MYNIFIYAHVQIKVIMSDLWETHFWKAKLTKRHFFLSKETTLFCLKDRRYKKFINQGADTKVMNEN